MSNASRGVKKGGRTLSQEHVITFGWVYIGTYTGMGRHRGVKAASADTAMMGRSPFKSIFNCFSGGVFFATTIMNLLPEALKIMEQVLDEVEIRGFNTQFKKYPITESLLGGGFLLILLIENNVAAWFVQASTKDEVNETPCQQDSDGVKLAIETGKEIKTSSRSSEGEIKYVSELEMETEFTETQEISKESYQFHDFLNGTHASPSLREAAETSSCKSSNQEDNDKNYGTIRKDSKSDINFPDN
ncbi:hypothetical protein CHS0354_013087 [Potamilus streckersoni]|uniref:Uncharacterized protein n=1 Tax=Potamilus streckersoni TaxID=2493646 RepID=A0AAE0SFL1_9BIVA|nr:hypothetical protein CHS0354_013087 [Potamilus streckersoni]